MIIDGFVYGLILPKILKGRIKQNENENKVIIIRIIIVTNYLFSLVITLQKDEFKMLQKTTD